MKKRLFLGILPALLILSACNGRVQQIEDKNIFLEDTLAHDEIFGGEETGNRDLKPYRLNDDPVTHPDSDASIGVQFFIDDKGTVDKSDDMVSIRFVAAVTFNESNITPTNAVWTRTVSSPDGTTFPKDTGTYECKKAYKKLNSGGAVYTIEQFNEAQEPDTSYTHFVVYTLRNIPKDTYANYYVSAYLTLSDGLSQTTKAIAVSVNANEKYVYTHNLGAYFIDRSSGIQNADSVRTVPDSDQDLAVFNSVTISKDETFVIKEFYNTKIFIHGASGEGNCLKGTDNPIGNYFENDGGLIKSKLDGSFTYKFFLNHNGELWLQDNKPTKCVRTVYIKTSDVSWWGNAGYRTALNAFGGSSDQSWLELVDTGDGYLHTKDPVDSDQFKKFIVARVPGDKFNKMGSGTNFDGVANQTSDQELGVSYYNCLSINTSGNPGCYWEIK